MSTTQNELLHWRMPGEDDHGQETRSALYHDEYADDTDEDLFVSGDGDTLLSASSSPPVRQSIPTPTLASAASSSSSLDANMSLSLRPPRPAKKLEWDWDVEHADRAREARLDGADALQVDRRVMREIVKEHMGADVVRIRFISSGTFHRAYLVTLASLRTVVIRVARRFMPRLKTESEVATLAYLRAHTNVPVPEVYAWDGNPYNRLGGEWILMSRARGIPLRKVYHSMHHRQLVAFLTRLAELLIPLFGHRFSHIGSLYFGEGKFNSQVHIPPLASTDGQCVDQKNDEELVHKDRDEDEDEHAQERTQTPTIKSLGSGSSAGAVAFAFGSSLPTPPSQRTPYPSNGHLTPRPRVLNPATPATGSMSITQSNSTSPPSFHIGPIISWPFFGSHRGELSHSSFPPEIDRGPWSSESAYLRACVAREVGDVARENEGRARPHRLHLDPDEVVPRGKKGGKGKGAKGGEYVWGYGYVKRVRLAGFGEDEDGSDESDGEAEGVDNDNHGSETPSDKRDSSDDEDDDDNPEGSPTRSVNSDSDEDVMYRDYRRYQRSTFLIAEIQRREKRVKSEMERWRKCMQLLEGLLKTVVNENGKGKEGWHKEGVGGQFESEVFGLDCHDLSLENVFVDEKDPTKITCIIDWESTTTRPLWACAHLPSFLLSSPFSAKLFRKAVASLPASRFPHASEWLALERTGGPLRYAHKCAEWDGWEEGLVGSILGDIDPDDASESEAPASFVGVGTGFSGFLKLGAGEVKEAWEEEGWVEPLVAQMKLTFLTPVMHGDGDGDGEGEGGSGTVGCGTGGGKHGHGAVPGRGAGAGALGRTLRPGALSPSACQGLRRSSHGAAAADAVSEREKMLDTMGDVCGGRGGELGRRLEAWLVETSSEE